MEIFKMAWRNVWRNRRRSLTSIAAMGFSLLIMLVWTGLFQGMLRDMEDGVVNLEVGDLQIFADDYRKNPSIYTRISDPESVLAPLDEAGFHATPRLLGFGLAASDESSAGASFRGIDVERDARVSRVYGEVEKGSWLDESDPKGVVIGKALARSLAVPLGGELLVFSQAADGSMAYELFRVRGILRRLGDAIDRSTVFMTQASFRELLVVPEGVHQIIVRRPQEVLLADAAAQVDSLASPLEVKTWKQILPTLASFLESARGMIGILYFIMYTAVGILLLNSMLMAVFERIREFGVMKALGVGPLSVMGLILIETGIQLGIALVSGLLVSLPALYYLSTEGINLAALAGISLFGAQMGSVLRAPFELGMYSGPVSMLFFIVLIAVIYPAVKAAMIQPVAAMEYR